MLEQYRKLLGVDEYTNLDDIKKAYKSLAKKYHPDMPSGNQELFKLINNAHDFLIKNYVETKHKDLNYEQDLMNANVYEKLTFYRIGFDKQPKTIILPITDTIRKNVKVVLQPYITGFKEFHISLPSDREFPLKLDVKEIVL